LVWEIHFHEDLAVVETEFDGVVSGDEMLEAAQARIAAGKRHKTHLFIIDAKKMIAPRSATVEVYEIPTKIYPKTLAERASRIAVVAPDDPDSVWVANFFEDVCINRGWQTRVFRDKPTAIAWLQEPSALNFD
jgi:hypothetical protein